MKILKKIFSLWDDFWFAPRDLIGLSMMRIQLGFVMLILYIARQFNGMQYYDSSAMVTKENALKIMNDFQRPDFHWFFWTDSSAFTIHIIFIVLVLLFMFGIGGRLVGIITWVLHIGFLQRNYAAIFGADLISCVLLFYLAMSKSNDNLNIFNLFKSKKNYLKPNITSDKLSIVMYRFIQIHICLIYFFTGIEKLKGASWWDGTALWTVLANSQMATFNMDFMRNFPLLIGASSFATLIFEIFWPAAIVLNPISRKVYLTLGYIFHTLIAVILGLPTFFLVMTSTYFLFIKPEELRKFIVKVQSKFIRTTV